MTSDNFKWSASVAMFGLVLRDSKYKQQSDINKVLQLSKASLGNDEHGYRSEFISLVYKSKDL
jgi:Ca-activated chloride channel family protein